MYIHVGPKLHCAWLQFLTRSWAYSTAENLAKQLRHVVSFHCPSEVCIDTLTVYGRQDCRRRLAASNSRPSAPSLRESSGIPRLTIFFILSYIYF